MADGTFQLRVFSGKGLEVEATVRSVSVPSQVGELGFLPGHRQFVGLLSTGIAEYVTTTDTTPRRCIVSGGICTFSDNVLTLLADTVDLPESFDRTQLSEDIGLLKTQLESLSLFDPEWEVLSQRVARVEALKAFSA